MGHKVGGRKINYFGQYYAGKSYLALLAFVLVMYLIAMLGVQIFKRQLNEGSDLTITHPDDVFSQFLKLLICVCMRKNMVGGEVFVSAMGAFDIVSLGQVIMLDNDLNFREIGMKPGENLKN